MPRPPARASRRPTAQPPSSAAGSVSAGLRVLGTCAASTALAGTAAATRARPAASSSIRSTISSRPWSAATATATSRVAGAASPSTVTDAAPASSAMASSVRASSAVFRSASTGVSPAASTMLSQPGHPVPLDQRRADLDPVRRPAHLRRDALRRGRAGSGPVRSAGCRPRLPVHPAHRQARGGTACPARRGPAGRWSVRAGWAGRRGRRDWWWPSRRRRRRGAGSPAGVSPSSVPLMKPAAKPSPAPTVSTTSTGKTLRCNTSDRVISVAPLPPSLTTTVDGTHVQVGLADLDRVLGAEQHLPFADPGQHQVGEPDHLMGDVDHLLGGRPQHRAQVGVEGHRHTVLPGDMHRPEGEVAGAGGQRQRDTGDVQVPGAADVGLQRRGPRRAGSRRSSSGSRRPRGRRRRRAI